MSGGPRRLCAAGGRFGATFACDIPFALEPRAETIELLVGRMKDVRDGGAAIVAAMTDDLVAGGGIRVTPPLDLWVHGVMGVEERIGTCTADAVPVEPTPACGNQWHPWSVCSSFAPISKTTHRFGRRAGCCTASSDEMTM